MIPFGFGLPFITRLSMTWVVITGLLVSIGIELLQLVTGLVGDVAFRVADINDVIFNTVGVAIGYGSFAGFVRGFRRTRNDWASANPILRHIVERPQV